MKLRLNIAKENLYFMIDIHDVIFDVLDTKCISISFLILFILIKTHTKNSKITYLKSTQFHGYKFSRPEFWSNLQNPQELTSLRYLRLFCVLLLIPPKH